MIVPDKVFKMRVNHDWEDLTTDEIFKDKRVVVFSLPGAFTPTCSSKQLPSYEENYDLIRSLGVHEVYCISVNDAFTMNAWGENLNIKKVKLLPDGDGSFTRDMNMLVNKPLQGFGMRSWRYSMVCESRRITAQFIEPGLNNRSLDDDPYIESTAEKMIEHLRNEVF